MIDLHVHSTESDGTDTPLELVALAKQVGLHAFALTDHDTIGGLKYARPAAKEAGIELVPGIELSTDYEGKEVHILGYYIDENNPDFDGHPPAEDDPCLQPRQRSHYPEYRPPGGPVGGL